MPILVTGGKGFIGREVVKRLWERGDEVVVMSRRPSHFPREMKDRVKAVSGDIREFSDVMRVVRDFQIDRIIHMVAVLTSAGEENPLAALQTNVLGMGNIFEAARIGGAKRIIFCSSVTVFGPQEVYGDRLLADEEILKNSALVYGATKALGEFMALKFEKRYGIEIPVLRIAPVYGRGREEWGGTAWTSQVVSAAVRGESVRIPLPSDQLGCFIYLDDVAEQLVRLCWVEKLNYRVYNSGGQTSTPGDFGRIIKKYYPEADIQFDEDAPRWPYAYQIDGARLAREINFQFRDLESGLWEQINQERSSLGQEALKRR